MAKTFRLVRHPKPFSQIQERPRRGPTSADLYTARIARKLSVLRKVGPKEVAVPHAVAWAAREIDLAAKLARGVLRGDKGAGSMLTGKLGGNLPLAERERLNSRPMGARAAALLAMAGNGPISQMPCRDRLRGDMELLQAAFTLDAVGGYRDARMTTRAAGAIRQSREVLAEFDARLDRAHDGTIGGRGEPGGLVPPDGVVSPPRRGPGSGEAPLVPPDDIGGLIPDPAEPDAGDFCLELSDVCADLFVGFAAASLADDESQLVASVQPNCVCANGFDDATVFAALPDTVNFPPQREDRRLIFTGDPGDGDITDRIVSWSETQIQFTIPAGSETGYVYIRRFVNSASAGLGGTLGNLCGLPDFGVAGRGLSPSPRALLGIIRAPRIESFMVEERETGPITAEACTALTLTWRVGLGDDAPGVLLPSCGRIRIEVRDSADTVLHQSFDVVGSWIDNPDADVTYHLHAESLIGAMACGGASSAGIEVHRENRIHLTPREPSTASVVAGRTGSFTVRLSCPAPTGGAEVHLQSSDRDILRLQDTVLVLPGETSAPVQFGTDGDHPGQAEIRACLAGHIDGTLSYDVVDNLTAIVLSGGGAKGSFQAGALLFLREIWHEVDPRIICGTSVGAINSLALAEATNASGVDKIERIWLGLEFNEDMYVPSPQLMEASQRLGFSISDVIFHEEKPPDLFDIYKHLIGLDTEAAKWAAAGLAIGGDFGTMVGGIARIFVGKPVDDVKVAVQALEDANFLLDLSPTADLIARNIDPAVIAASGMRLRLATVALEDGGLYYVTEAGRLMRGRADFSSLDEPIIAPSMEPTDAPLVIAAMASAAIPAVFEARRILTSSTAFFHVDGGTREILPAQAAVELGAQLIYNISSAPSIPAPAPKPGQSFGDPGMFFSIARRGLDLQTNEVAIEEKHPRAGFCDERERVLIQPTLEVHDTVVIDPGLIRINMAFGYFRAFDAEGLRRGEILPLEYILWSHWAHDLIFERMECHRLELNDAMVIARNSGFFDHSLLEHIRIRKNRIAELILERFNRFGPDAFPPRLREPRLGDQSVLDWCDTWEVHQDPHRTFLEPVDLWTPQLIAFDPPVAGGTGLPPGPEPSTLARFPLPEAVRNGLLSR